jgi:hypothetical protein
MGDIYKSEFVNFVVKEARNIAVNMRYPSIVIDIIRSYLKKYRTRVAKELPKFVEAIL